LAITDPLTGVFNRRHFFELTQQELTRAQRYGLPISTIMLDLDHFKQINDRYGHLVGDHVLQEVAESIRDNIRTVDILGRYGGEEFTILLPNTALPGTREIAERVCEMIASLTLKMDDDSVLVTASLGVVSVEDVTDISIEVLLNRADQALYAAKQSGRNQITIWKESPHLS
jgi:diguanylate cyclase (GGDEF)-like protein